MAGPRAGPLTTELFERVPLDLAFCAGNPNLAIEALVFQIIRCGQGIATVVASSGHKQHEGPPKTAEVGQLLNNFGDAIAGAIHQLLTRNVEFFSCASIEIAHLCHTNDLHGLAPFLAPTNNACATA